MLLASALDGDNHIFPLGLGIVNSENDSSWEWFLSKLKECMGDRDDLVIISDRHISIPKAVSNVFPLAKHAICMQHLCNNLKTRFHHGAIEPFFKTCAKAYKTQEFEKFMTLLERIDPGIKKYLEDADPLRWSRALFPGKRYNIMTTNISESMNARLLEARGLPVSQLVIEYRNILQGWFFDRLLSGQSMNSSLTTWASLNMSHENEEKARSMLVSNSKYF